MVNLTKKDKEELIEALSVIKNICEKSDCWDCPFGRGNFTCTLKEDDAENWIFNDPEDKTWRAII